MQGIRRILGKETDRSKQGELMTTKREAINACLTFAGIYEDYPFDEGNWAAMRHRGNGKVFAFVLDYKGQLLINVKHTPEDGLVWRELYPAIKPAYHMNKVHWSSIYLDGSIKDSTVMVLLEKSYDLTKPKKKMK